MEVLDPTNTTGDRHGSDEGETLNDGGARDTDSSDSSSSSDSGSGSEADASKTAAQRAADGIKSKATDLTGGKNDVEDGRRGPKAQLQDYREHRKTLHRRHCGLMQWKGARTVDWMMGKARRGRDKIVGLTEHGKREPGVETEVGGWGGGWEGKGEM